MDFRDIVLWLGLIAIVVILWDGFRRMKRISKPKATKRVEEPYIDPEEAAKQAEISRELPNGGARKREMTDEERRQIASRLNLRERVPMLMERVDVEPPEPEDEGPVGVVQSELDFTAAMAERPAQEDSVKPVSKAEAPPEEIVLVEAVESEVAEDEIRDEDDIDDEHVTLDETDLLDHEEADDEDVEEIDNDDEGVVYVEPDDLADEDDVVADIYSKGPEPKPEAVIIKEVKPKAKVAAEPEPAPEPEVESKEKTASQGPVEELVIMHVMAPNDGELSGSAVLNLLLAAGLRHGPMEIFHYRNPKGYTEFSLANCVHPGTFNPDSMNQVNTPGVTLFMQLPTGAEIMEAFDHMHQMADYLAKNLDAVILDEDHNKVTSQRLEYYRENLRAYARSKLIPS